MLQFFKYVIATLTGFALFFGLVIALFAGLAQMGEKDVEIADNSVLRIALNVPILDRSTDNPFQNFDPMSGKSETPLGLYGMLESIKRAKTDDKIKGIYLDLEQVSAGYATVEEIRDALIDFKESEKFIISYSEMYSQKAYYLASIADEIYLYPEGALSFSGIQQTIMFMKGMFEKLEIEPQVIRYGKFKSAIEPFVREEMSEPNKEQTMTYVGGIWEHYKKGVAEARGISEEKLQEIADSLWVRKASDAVEYKLADKLMYKDEVLSNLRERLGLEEGDKIAAVGLRKYGKVKGKSEPGKMKKKKVAVIFAQGNIVDGEGDDGQIASAPISKAIRKARNDKKVKALVLRVNSGGGSALASDVIWREMLLTKEKMPVVVSMGDVAASGGYYISCAADTILASENTITGSIGVFGLLPNMKGFWNNKMGITFDGIKTANYADMGNVSRGLTKAEEAIIQESVNDVYSVFTNKVAEGRDMTQPEVDSIGQGRVWCGIDAMRIGLVDVYGGLNKAVELAAEMADLEEYRVSAYPKQKDPIEQLIKELTGEAETRIVENYLGKDAKILKYVKEVAEMEGVQARLPYYFDIE